ncbi:MAG: ATP-binding protein, partial [Acidobacteriota bacterium]|nr:ATP-binding protein [Acidobacteriota bacterium]
NGLNQYDGYRVMVYRHEPGVANSLPDNQITALAETNEGGRSLIWIGTMQGLASYDPSRLQFTRYLHNPGDAETLSSNEIQALHVDRSGALWVGTREGLNRYDAAKGKFARHQHRATDSRTLTSGTVTSIVEAKDGGLWAGTDGGLSLMDPATGRVTRFTHSPIDASTLADNRVRALQIDRSGRLWIGTERAGLDRYDAGRFIHYPPGSAGITGASVNDILEDAEGQLWIGVSGGGINRLVEDTATGRTDVVAHRHDPAIALSIGNDDVNALMQDRSGIIWAGTERAGLSRFSPGGRIRVTQYRHVPSRAGTLSDDRVSAIHVDRMSAMWVGTHDALNVLRSGAQAFERVTLPGGAGSSRVSAISEAADGTIWVGTLDSGIHRVDPRTLRAEYVAAAPHEDDAAGADRVTALTVDRRGWIWIGTLEAGLRRFEPATGTVTLYRSNIVDSTTLTNNRIERVFEDHRGTMWIATGGGLDAMDPLTGRVQRVGAASAAPEPLRGRVTSIDEFPNGLIWAGTATGGVIRFATSESGAPSDFKSFSREQGLASELVHRVMHDADGMLWVATAEGLNRFDPRTNAMLRFDAADGLQSDEFRSGGFYDASARRVLLGGPKGLSVFRTSDVRPDGQAPAIVLTGFTILNRPVPIGGDSPLQTHISDASEVRLQPLDTVFSFEFAAFDFTAPERVRYAYRLQGFVNDWSYTDASRRSATYTNLGPGTYTFEVRAANRDGVWTPEPARLKVVILPPYWKTWWFRTAIVATLLAAALFLHRRRLSVVERQRRALEQQVRDRTAELRDQTKKATKAQAAAERANADKSMFLANVTHEIRTPLNAVVGLSDVLGGTRLNPQQREYARALRSAGEALSEIIADILDVSKIEADRFELVRAAFELRHIIAESLDVVRVAAGNKALAIEVEVAQDVPHTVLGDHRALRRILLNLLGNAVKFTEKGVVSLHVARSPEPSAVVFIVTDSGIGIAKEEQERVFESFVQADATISSKYGGTGLGLAISKKLVALMEGRIWVESVPGHGSTFSFTAVLPMVAPSLEAPEPEPGDAALPPLRVMVVDDAEQNRMVMRAYFQGTPHRVMFAEHGDQAVEIFTAGEFDLVLMDVHMPGMDGYAATRTMRAWEHAWQRKRTPIVAVTANAYAQDIEESRRAGCDGHLTKPIRKPVLFDALRHYAGVALPIAAQHPAPGTEHQAPDTEHIPPPSDRADFVYTTVPREVGPYIPGYLAVTREQLSAALTSLEGGDGLPLRTLGHNLKGSGASFGLDEVSRLGWQLERATSRNDIVASREIAASLTNYLDRVQVVSA